METIGLLLILFVGMQAHSVIGGPSPAVGTDSPSDTAYHKEADQFLTSYGYYYPSNGLLPTQARNPSPREHTDAERTKAIKLFQKFYNLPQSGYLDKETKQLMQTPRCGNPDITSYLSTMETPSESEEKEDDEVSQTMKNHENQDTEESGVNVDREKRSLDMSRKKRMTRQTTNGNQAKWTEKEMRWMVTQPSKRMTAVAPRITMRRALSRWVPLVPFKFVETTDVSKAHLRFIFHPFLDEWEEMIHREATLFDDVLSTRKPPLEDEETKKRKQEWYVILQRKTTLIEDMISTRRSPLDEEEIKRKKQEWDAIRQTGETLFRAMFSPTDPPMDDELKRMRQEWDEIVKRETALFEEMLSTRHSQLNDEEIKRNKQEWDEIVRQQQIYFKQMFPTRESLPDEEEIKGNKQDKVHEKTTSSGDIFFTTKSPMDEEETEKKRQELEDKVQDKTTLSGDMFTTSRSPIDNKETEKKKEESDAKETTRFGDMYSTLNLTLDEEEIKRQKQEWDEIVQREKALFEEIFSTRKSPLGEEEIKRKKKAWEDILQRETTLFEDISTRKSPMDEEEINRKKQEWEKIVHNKTTMFGDLFFTNWSPMDDTETTRQKQAYSHAHALAPTSEPIREIHFDDNYDWKLDELKSVALHEIGHALGLGHNNHPASVMNPYNKGVSHFSLADLEAVKQIYGSKDGALDKKMCDAKLRELDNIFKGPIHLNAQSYYIISGNRVQSTSEKEYNLTYHSFNDMFPNAPSKYSVVFASGTSKINFIQGRKLIQHEVGAKNAVNTLEDFVGSFDMPKFAVNIDTPAGRRTRLFADKYSWDLEFKGDGFITQASRSYSSAFAGRLKRAKFAVQWKDGLVYIVTQDGRHAIVNVTLATDGTDTVSREMPGHPGWMRRLLCEGRAGLCDGPICPLSRGHSTKAWGVSRPGLMLVVMLSLIKLY